MNNVDKISYIELPSSNFPETKAFFEEVFGWEFQDYGPDYMAFTKSGVDGGFYKSELSSRRSEGGALIVLYSDNLEDSFSKVVDKGGVIIEEIFSFPGGRRFHFLEPSNNEFAIWSEK